MGSGIAQVAAQAGWNVILIDQSSEVLAHSEVQLQKVCNRLIEKKRLTEIGVGSVAREDSSNNRTSSSCSLCFGD